MARRAAQAVTVKRYDSLSEYVDYISTAPRSGQSHRLGYDFTRSNSFDHAKELAFGGWKEGAETINKLRASIKPKGLNPRSYVRRSVVGPGTFNMGAIVQGRPDAYVQLRKTNEIQHGKGKIIRIVENVVVSGGIRPEVIEMRGAAMVALADSLESQGRRCEIILAMGTSFDYQGKAVRETFITVKKASDRVNIPKLAFAMAHPSMLRRFYFAQLELDTIETGYEWSPGFGYPADVNHDDATVYLASMTYGDTRFDTVNRAREWVRDELHKQGIRLADERGQIASK